MVKINELVIKKSYDELNCEIIEAGETKEVMTKYGNTVNMQKLQVKDDSGIISLTVWGDNTNMFNMGDNIIINNFVITAFRGEPQISLTKSSRLYKR